MSQEKAFKTLEDLGFTQLDARVYVLLAKKGPQKAGEIAKFLKLPKQTVYFIIKNLQKAGVVTSTVERPAKFSAVAFERVLDLFVKTKIEEAQNIQRNKNEILLDWQSITVEKNDETSPKFTVIEGRNIIYSKIQQMIQQTQEHLSTITTIPNLVRANCFGLFDPIFEKKSTIKFRFLTELEEQDIGALKGLLKKNPKQKINLEIKTPDLSLKLSRMVIRDDKEAIFFINANTDPSTLEKDEVCLWTDCRELVQSFVSIFEDSWNNATNVETRIEEIENGKTSPKTIVIKNPETAYEKYAAFTRLAQRDILILTSSTGLVEYFKNRNQAKVWAQSGVSVRIMAPIVNENLEAAQQLMKFCEVKHIPIGYVGATIIDSKYLFQFKTPTSRRELNGSLSYFENSIFTDDSEFVKKTENVLNDLWKNASVPSIVPLKSIVTASAPKVIGSSGKTRYSNYRKIIGWIEETEQTNLTEKDVLDKILNAEKISIKDPLNEVSVGYFSSGMSVIHPPPYLNLPDMIVMARHVDKQSSFGAEDMLAIFLEIKTPSGHEYVRAATVGDNPVAVEFRKKLNAGTLAEQYCHLVGENEIQARLHGNTLFVGWTVPIPLYPPPLVLPPACIMFEGYGKLNTGVVKTQTSSGHVHVSEFNGFDAFVTFFHPASKYSGPGTDGFLRRDVIMTSYPPKLIGATHLSQK